MRLQNYPTEFMIAIVVILDITIAIGIRYAVMQGLAEQAHTLGYVLAGVDVVFFIAFCINLPSAELPEEFKSRR